MAYIIQYNKTDTLAATLNSGATSTTLTTGSFGSPSGTQLYVVDWDVPAKAEIISASVTTTAVTGITRGLTGGAAGTTDHAIGAKIASIFLPQHYAALSDGTNIADDSILARHINWAGTGANGGIWWEELGRTTLSGAGDTISVTSIAARKYLRVLIYTIPTGGTIAPTVRFNNDTAANYSLRYDVNNGTVGTSVSQTSISLDPTTAASETVTDMFVVNVAAQEKVVTADVSGQGTAGAGNAPVRIESVGKWANTAAQITRVDIVNAGAGDFATGSEVVVLGHD